MQSRKYELLQLLQSNVECFVQGYLYCLQNEPVRISCSHDEHHICQQQNV